MHWAPQHISNFSEACCFSFQSAFANSDTTLIMIILALFWRRTFWTSWTPTFCWWRRLNGGPRSAASVGSSCTGPIGAPGRHCESDRFPGASVTWKGWTGRSCWDVSQNQQNISVTYNITSLHVKCSCGTRIFMSNGGWEQELLLANLMQVCRPLVAISHHRINMALPTCPQIIPNPNMHTLPTPN